MFIEMLPELAGRIAEPLGKTEKIVIVGGGGGEGAGAGASKVTRDVTNIMAQLPPALEAVSGIDLSEIIKRIGSRGGKSDDGGGKPDAAGGKA
jgi:flotillin